jgi:hypothetical protein
MKKQTVKALLKQQAEGVYVLESQVSRMPLGVIYLDSGKRMFIAHTASALQPFIHPKLSVLVKEVRDSFKEQYDFRILNIQHYLSGLQDDPPDVVRNDFIDPKDAQRVKVKAYERRREMRRLQRDSEHSTDRRD